MKTEREKMTNAEPFLTNDPQLMEDKKNARILCSRFNDSPEDESVRKSILKELLGFTATTDITSLWAMIFS